MQESIECRSCSTRELKPIRMVGSASAVTVKPARNSSQSLPRLVASFSLLTSSAICCHDLEGLSDMGYHFPRRPGYNTLVRTLWHGKSRVCPKYVFELTESHVVRDCHLRCLPKATLAFFQRGESFSPRADLGLFHKKTRDLGLSSSA